MPIARPPQTPSPQQRANTSFLRGAGLLSWDQGLQKDNWHHWWYVLVALAGAVAYVSEPKGEVAFVFLTLLLSFFVLVEIIGRARQRRETWFLEPPVLASAFTFGLVYGLTNFIYLLPAEAFEATGLIPEVTPAMNKLMAMVLIAAVAMWFGFRVNIGASFGKTFFTWFKHFLRREYKISLFWCFAFVAVSIWARYQQISLGVYGYSSDYEALLRYASIREYAEIGASLGIVTLLAVSLAFFATGNRTYLVVALVLVLLETAFGFGSGFKTRVLIPTLVVGVAYVVIRKRFPLSIVPILVGLLFFAYAIIEPFRIIRHQDLGFRGTSITAISAAISEVASGVIGSISDSSYGESPAAAIMLRSNITFIGSLGVEYADTYAELDEDAPAFLADLFWSPLHALIPRAIWESKPPQTLGLWYAEQVLGSSTLTSIGMGPVTYLYFTGGVLAVVIAFFMLGIFQHALMLIPEHGESGGWFLFLLLLPTVVLVDSSFNTVVIGIVRYSFVYLLMQWLLFRR